MKSLLHSRWSKQIGDFIAVRRAYLTSVWPAPQLRRFDSFAASHPHLSLREAIASWINADPDRHPLTRSNDLTAVRQFCLYRRRFDPEGFVPEQMLPVTAVKRHFQACILTSAQIKLLLHSIDDLQGPPLRLQRMRALFLVLYCTGLRLGEALHLCVADMDLQETCFRIGPSKGRIRLVPFGRDLAYELNKWLDLRRKAGFTLAPQTRCLHYADKNALLQAMTAARFRALIARRGLFFTDCDGALRAIALGVCDYLAETTGCPSQLTKMHLEGSIIPAIEGMFLEGARNHPVPPGVDPGLLGTTAAWAIFGAARRWLQTPNRISAEEMAARIEQMVKPIFLSVSR